MFDSARPEPGTRNVNDAMSAQDRPTVPIPKSLIAAVRDYRKAMTDPNSTRLRQLDARVAMFDALESAE